MKKVLILLAILLSLSIVSAQVSKLSISLNKNEISPGENLTYRIFAYDAENNPLNKLIKIEIKNAYSSAKTLEVNSNEANNLEIEPQALAGYWKIIASVEEKSSQEIFSVKRFESADFEIENNYLLIKNAGNVIYKKDVQILIGSTVITKETFLDVGESIKIKLIAPEGVYNIKISDGTKTIIKNNVALTGNFIGALEEQNSSIDKKYPIIWIFFILIFGMFVLLVLRKISSRKK